MDSMTERLIRACPEDQRPWVLQTTKSDVLQALERLREVVEGMGDFDRFPEGAAGVILFALMRAQADACPDVGDFSSVCQGCERLLADVGRAIGDEFPLAR